jgi:protein Mpv17
MLYEPTLFDIASIHIARFYQQSFDAYPHRTLAVTNGALNGLGDAVAQFSQRFVSYIHHLLEFLIIDMQFGPEVHENPHIYDLRRTFRFFGFGFGMG